MKATLLVVVFAAFFAFTAAAKDKKAGATPKRCGAGSGLKCASGETCVGEYSFKGEHGVCMKNPITCGSTQDHPDTTCPGSTYRCLPRANYTFECPQDVAYCGYCVPKEVVNQIGLKKAVADRIGPK